MGGDLVLDSEGNVIYIHCSKTPTDRPSVDLVLNILKVCITSLVTICKFEVYSDYHRSCYDKIASMQ